MTNLLEITYNAEYSSLKPKLILAGIAGRVNCRAKWYARRVAIKLTSYALVLSWKQIL